MLVANLATLIFIKAQIAALWLFQGEGTEINWDPLSLWRQMGWPARAIVIILLIMSAWSIGVMIDRWVAFNAARKQSRQFAPAVAGALREGKLDEAIRVAERNKKSHLAKVVTVGALWKGRKQLFTPNSSVVSAAWLPSAPPPPSSDCWERSSEFSTRSARCRRAKQPVCRLWLAVFRRLW